jgi:hypothetical protein
MLLGYPSLIERYKKKIVFRKARLLLGYDIHNDEDIKTYSKLIIIKNIASGDVYNNIYQYILSTFPAVTITVDEMACVYEYEIEIIEEALHEENTNKYTAKPAIESHKEKDIVLRNKLIYIRGPT